MKWILITELVQDSNLSPYLVIIAMLATYFILGMFLDDIEQMRLSATKALLERRDTIIVASVSAIYGLAISF